MDGLSHFRRLLSYDHWAAIETHSSIRRAGDPPPKSLRWLGHILGAEWLWLGRLRGQEKAVEVWPDLSLDECQGQIADLAPAWRTYLDRLGPDDLSQSVSYTNTKGEPWTSRVEDILIDPATPPPPGSEETLRLIRDCAETIRSATTCSIRLG